MPTEKDKSTLPPYTIEPPDILFIEAVRVVPKPPYHIQATDVLAIDIDELPEAEPDTDNRYLVDPAGRVDLGPHYGKVKVGGMTEDEAVAAIRQPFIEERLRRPAGLGATGAVQRPCSRSPASTWSRPTARSTWAPTAWCTWPA